MCMIQLWEEILLSQYICSLVYEVMQNLNCLNIMLNCSDTVAIDDLKELGKNFMQSQAQ